MDIAKNHYHGGLCIEVCDITTHKISGVKISGYQSCLGPGAKADRCIQIVSFIVIETKLLVQAQCSFLLNQKKARLSSEF